MLKRVIPDKQTLAGLIAFLLFAILVTVVPLVRLNGVPGVAFATTNAGTLLLWAAVGLVIERANGEIGLLSLVPLWIVGIAILAVVQ